MSNVITYVFNMGGNMDAMLQKLGVSASQSKKGVDDLGKSAKGLNKVNLSGFLSSIGKVAGMLGIGVGIGATIGKTIKMGMEQEMRNTSFEVLFGGVDNAKKMIDEISGYAAKSPYGKAGLSEATQMMAGFGIAQEKIIPNLKMIGDIAMGDEQKFKSLALAFSQMSSTGKLTGQDLLQMINVGFNPLEQMAKTTGKSIAVLKEEMSKGAISADMVTQAFSDATSQGGLYHGMIDKISTTAGGQWATAMSNVNEILLGIYTNVIQPLLLPALKAVNAAFDHFGGTILNSVSSAFQEVNGYFKSLVDMVMNSNIFSYFQAVSDLVTNYIVPYIAKLWDFIKDIVARVVDFVGQSTLLRDLWIGLMDYAKAMYTVLSWVIDGLEWLFDNVVMPILWGIEKAYRFITGSTPDKVEIVTKTPLSSIAPAAVPGTTNVAAVGTGSPAMSGMGGMKGGGAGKNTADSIATGGTKTTHITIHIAEMGNNMKIYANGIREGAANMRDMILDELTRALSMAQGQAG